MVAFRNCLLGLLFSAAAAEEGSRPRLPATLQKISQANGAACLDGSAPTFYVMPGDPEKFYLHMEGGGWCISLEDCAKRAGTGTGTSKFNAQTTDFQGMVDGWGGWYLSNSTSINPMMASWTKVLVNYCDGASWAGNNATPTYYLGKQLHFRGKANLDGLIESLKADLAFKFATATDVVVSGGSAGGLSTYLHTDTFRAALPPRTKVVGMPDAGFFLDDPVSVASGWRAGVIWAAEVQNTSASANPACLEHYSRSGEAWKCFFAQYTAPFVQSPLFALQSMYDAYQTSAEVKSRAPSIVNAYAANLSATLEASLSLLAVGGADSTATAAFMNGVGTDTVVAATTHKNGAFLDACWHHSGAWPSLQINGTTAWDAMAEWYTGTGRRYWKEEAPAGFPCTECCPARHPPACDGGCSSCCGPLWG